MSAKGKNNNKRKGVSPQDGSVPDGPPPKKGAAAALKERPVTPNAEVELSLTCEVNKGGCGKVFSSERWLKRHHSKAEEDKPPHTLFARSLSLSFSLDLGNSLQILGTS